MRGGLIVKTLKSFSLSGTHPIQAIQVEIQGLDNQICFKTQD